MKRCPAESKRWNLFVRELEDLLRKRERDLNDLISQAELHPEKVRRLKQSLISPKFHLLSPEDLEQVVVAFQFTAEEQLRLRAAILATAVEETLMNRIDADNALRAAEEIFPLLVKALQRRFGQQRGLAATRGSSIVGTVADDALEAILKQFDQAMLALHLSQQEKNSSKRTEQLAYAHGCFIAVLADLEALKVTDPATTLTDAWQVWHRETQKGLAITEEPFAQIQS